MGEPIHVEDIRELYGRLVKKAAAFMVGYREPMTKLPGPSYDLWEVNTERSYYEDQRVAR